MTDQVRTFGELIQGRFGVKHLRLSPRSGDNGGHTGLNGHRDPVNQLCRQFQIVFAGTGQLMYLLIANVE